MGYQGQVSSKEISSERVFGLDLVRTISFYTIAAHHFTVTLWKTPGNFSPYRYSSTIWNLIEEEARLLSFSGHTVLFLTSLLIAYTAKNHEKALRIIPILLIMWFLSSLFDASSDSFFFAWDIFPLIAVGMGLSYFFTLLFPKPISFWLLSVLGFLLMSVPFWRFQVLQQLPLYPRHILIGDCPNDLSDWPILPWVGLVLWGYGIGCLIKEYPTKLAQFSKKELYAWTLLLAWTPMYWGTYYKMLLGSHYSCESMRQEPVAFLAHLFGIMFILRLCFLQIVNNFFKRFSLARFISGLEININFGMAYFYHFILISMLIYIFNPTLAASPWFSAFISFLLLPLTEISLRLFKIIFRLFKTSS